jgi:diguanylate cyclase (GGDEF)-like protein/PAS domain S-box-containing protein
MSAAPEDIRQELLDTLHLLFRYIHAPEPKLLDFALEAGVRVTGSDIGYIYLVSADETELHLHAWSKSVMAQCAVENINTTYKVGETGLWGEALRQRRPVITNDLASSPYVSGFPDGHVPVSRHMNLPVFDGDRIVIIAGVGNRETGYGEAEVNALSLVMGATWNILKRKRSEKRLEETNAQLEKIVDERTEEYETANAELHRIIEQQQTTRAELASKSEQLEIIVNNVPALIAYVDRGLKYRFVNSGYRDLLFPGKKDVSGRPISDLLPEDVFSQVKDRYKAALEGKEQRFEMKARVGDDVHILDVVYIPHRFSRGIEGVFVLITDITERKGIELELKAHSDRLALAKEAGGIGVWEWLPETESLNWDDQMLGLYQISREEFQRDGYTAWRRRVHPDDLPGVELAWDKAMARGGRFEAEFRIIRPDGRQRSIQAAALASRDDKTGKLKMTGVNWDVTEQKEMEARLKHLSVTDPLTGARNRRYFMDKTRTEIARARRYELPLSLLTMDIDHFKVVNDTLGHDTGDEVLKSCVTAWGNTLRQTDIFSRIGGEEFAVLLVQTGGDQALSMAERLRKTIETLEISCGREPVRVTVSIGVTSFRGGEDSLDQMMKRSDTALYTAKEKGRNQVVPG